MSATLGTAYHAPRELSEALAIKGAHGRGVTILAGGTDLMVGLRPGERRFERVLDIFRVAELHGTQLQEDGTLAIGAATTFAEIIRSREVTERLPVLRDAARTIGSLQIQARATLGGNVVNASPAADSVPVLAAWDARLVLASARQGERPVSIHDFYLDYKKLDLRDDELLVRVEIPQKKTTWSAYRKIGTRAAQSIAKVGVAVRVHLAGREISDIALAYASMGPTVVRARSAEQLLRTYAVQNVPHAQVRRALTSDLKAITDVRSTKDYRHRVAANVTVRLLRELEAAAPR